MKDIDTLGTLLAFSALGVTIFLLNVFFLIWGFLYRGSWRVATRALWISYVIVPFLVAGWFALSVHRRPLSSCPEPFGSDGRPLCYAFLALTLNSLLAVIGVIIMASSQQGAFGEEGAAPRR